MSDEIKLQGLGVAPGVLETIVTLAAESVEGVARVGVPGLVGLVRKGGGKGASRSAEVSVDDGGDVSVVLHVDIVYGHALRTVAGAVQDAVADALASQVGLSVDAVDVFVDGIEFGS
ncbi:MAG: Asp23/Gls24 family envelope stress response protein [Coriobacteriia bacterium]|nr:Asp23/Gls24 family envelope stress response protein [Coriobacteriia bacterium]